MSRGLWWSIAYLLHLPTYRLLILASALAYYFLSGLRAFTMIYFTAHYHLARSTLVAMLLPIGLAALGGVVIGGRISEVVLRRGHVDARIIVPAVALFCSVPPLAVAFWVSSPAIGIPLRLIGVALLCAAIAPIDAARLDIVHPRMWGRGEAGRMLLRSTFDGTAPLLFGVVASLLGAGTVGLEHAFLLMLIPMLIAGGLAIPARKTYPRDVATAAASVHAPAERS